MPLEDIKEPPFGCEPDAMTREHGKSAAEYPASRCRDMARNMQPIISTMTSNANSQRQRLRITRRRAAGRETKAPRSADSRLQPKPRPPCFAPRRWRKSLCSGIHRCWETAQRNRSICRNIFQWMSISSRSAKYVVLLNGSSPTAQLLPVYCPSHSDVPHVSGLLGGHLDETESWILEFSRSL